MNLDIFSFSFGFSVGVLVGIYVIFKYANISLRKGGDGGEDEVRGRFKF